MKNILTLVSALTLLALARPVLAQDTGSDEDLYKERKAAPAQTSGSNLTWTAPVDKAPQYWLDALAKIRSEYTKHDPKERKTFRDNVVARFEGKSPAAYCSKKLHDEILQARSGSGSGDLRQSTERNLAAHKTLIESIDIGLRERVAKLRDQIVRDMANLSSLQGSDQLEGQRSAVSTRLNQALSQVFATPIAAAKASLPLGDTLTAEVVLHEDQGKYSAIAVVCSGVPSKRGICSSLNLATGEKQGTDFESASKNSAVARHFGGSAGGTAPADEATTIVTNNKMCANYDVILADLVPAASEPAQKDHEAGAAH